MKDEGFGQILACGNWTALDWSFDVALVPAYPNVASRGPAEFLACGVEFDRTLNCNVLLASAPLSQIAKRSRARRRLE